MTNEWKKAYDALEGVRPYEDGYERDSVHRLIDAGDKLQTKLNEITEVVQEFCRLYEEDDDKFASAIIYQIKGILLCGEKRNDKI